MSWDHRVIRKSDLTEVSYEIYEVYYENDGIMAWTKEAVQPFGETLEELQADIRSFLKASGKPVLEEKEVEGKLTLVAVGDDDN